MTEPGSAPENAAQQGPGVVRLRWLKILRYRNIRAGTELRFDDNFNIFLGKNGSGKTTLLRLLAAVISSDFRLLDEPYELEYLLDINGVQLAIRAWTTTPAALTSAPQFIQPQLVHHFSASFQQGADGLHCDIEVDQQGGKIAVRGGEERVFKEIWGFKVPSLHKLSTLISIGPFSDILGHTREQISTIAMDLGGSVRRFDESLDTFREITGTSPPEEGHLRAPHVVGVISRQGADKSLVPFPETTGSFWRNICLSRQNYDRIRTEDFKLETDTTSFLNNFRESVGAKKADARLTFVEKQVFDEAENWHYRALKFQFTRPDGSIFSHEHLSYGQKRLMAFFYYLAVNEYIVIADELVNGLHHEWIKSCLDQMGERQAFLTSQNPLLLDYLPPGSAEQAQKRYLLCRCEPTERGEELIWENMPAADAERFFRAYEVGVRQASEVLLSKGLW